MQETDVLRIEVVVVSRDPLRGTILGLVDRKEATFAGWLELLAHLQDLVGGNG